MTSALIPIGPSFRKVAISKNLSRSIEHLRFPFAVAVVLIHAGELNIWLPGGEAGGGTGKGTRAEFATYLLSQVLARVAVPSFFMISGFLLCASQPVGWTAWCAKFRSRIRTLLIPFCFWNLIVLLLYVGGQAFEPTRQFFSGRFLPLGQATAWDYANALFGFSGTPIDVPLWFVRDLLLLVVSTPVVAMLAKRCAIPTLVVLMIQWLGLFPTSWRIPLVSPEAILFFTIGVTFAYRMPGIELPRVKVVALIPIVYLTLCLVETFLETAEPLHRPWLHQANILLGIVAAFVISGSIPPESRVGEILKTLAPTAFFLFAVHSPILSFVRKILFFAFRPQDPTRQFFWLFCVASLVTISFCLAVFFTLLRCYPAFLQLTAGLAMTRPLSKSAGSIASVE